MAELNSPESWDKAKQIAALIGPVPSLFGTCIRFLTADGERNKGELSRSSFFCIDQLLKSESVLTCLYFAALTFRPERLEKQDNFSSRTIQEFFKAHELALLIALLYLYRRIQKGCNAEEWAFLAPDLFLQSEIGGLVGSSIPALGLSNGLLIGSIRQLACAMYLGIDEKRYTKYRRALKNGPTLFDIATEQENWGCNHAQVGSMLLQTLGLGVKAAGRLCPGLLSENLSDDTLSPEAYETRLLSVWIRSLFRTGAPPDIVHKGQYYPKSDELKKLLAAAQVLHSVGTTHAWLSRSKDDISEEQTPHLIRARKAAATRRRSVKDDEIPEELQGKISVEELQNLEE